MKTLQERINLALAEGLSAQQLADAAKVSRSAVSQWRSGTIVTLKGKTAARLAALTGWSALWWATGEGPRVSAPPPPTPIRPSTSAGAVVAREPLPSYTPDLARALQVLGTALAADLPDAVRTDLADALAKLAMRGGTERDQRLVLALLTETPSKQQTAA